MVPLKTLREFHNYIKRLYINKYITKPDTKLLDLATGKGGDLQKWKANKYISYVLGFDINSESIKEAKNRLKKAKIKFKIIFKIKDLSIETLNCNIKYDIITSYFAFHYFFKNPSSLNTILKSINNCSKSGTILILALFDGTKLKNIDNKDFKINIKQKPKEKNYGNEVEVYIKDSVLNIPEIEFIVKPKFLISKLKKINFELLEMNSFKDLKSEKFKLTKDEEILSFLNNIYVFIKI